MKQVYTLLLLLLATVSLHAQEETPQAAPYQRFPNNIPFEILLPDSSTVLKSAELPDKQPFIIMLFSPDCEHCKAEVNDIKASIDRFKEVKIYMVTPLPFEKMKQFYTDYELAKYPNIVMGRDIRFLLPGYYQVKFFPYLAFYGKKKQFKSVFEGNLSVDQMLEKLGQ